LVVTFGLLALAASATFAGAALYVTVAEQPARLSLDDRALLAEWKPSYKRGVAMQAPLALVTFLLGMLAWWSVAHPGFLVGALLIMAPGPWTLFVIKPINDVLLATDLDEASSQTRALIIKWGTAHTLRTVLGLLATAAFWWACM
jgi:hypothetical protein